MKQITILDLFKAESIMLFMDDTMFVELPGEGRPYCINRGDKVWTPGEKLWCYPEYEALIYYTRILTPKEAIDLLIDWGYFDKDTDIDFS